MRFVKFTLSSAYGNSLGVGVWLQADLVTRIVGTNDPATTNLLHDGEVVSVVGALDDVAAALGVPSETPTRVVATEHDHDMVNELMAFSANMLDRKHLVYPRAEKVREAVKWAKSKLGVW